MIRAQNTIFDVLCKQKRDLVDHLGVGFPLLIVLNVLHMQELQKTPLIGSLIRWSWNRISELLFQSLNHIHLLTPVMRN